ncbi:MAG: RnfABCDGE type electron transport complex subunit G [Eubacteriales bacterium]|nr:RnfABCDGE type electron transport complex subunit G [Eubacteriales bacterium]
MKTESTVKFVLRLALTLFAITAVVAGCLAGVNAITEPRIAALNEEKTQAAIEAVLPGGGTLAGTWSDSTGFVSKVYESDTGYAVEVKPNGFDNTITMMVGVDKAGKVLGISVISHTETAGLGATCAAKTAAGEAFRDQFAGMSGQVAVTKDGGSVDAITGATITSRAVCAGVNAALECVANMG